MTSSGGKCKLPFKKYAFLVLILSLFLIPLTTRLCKTSHLFLDTAFLMAFSREACPPSLGKEEKPCHKLKCPACLRTPTLGQVPALPVAVGPGPSRWHSWMVFLPDVGSIRLQLPQLPHPSCPPGERASWHDRVVPGDKGWALLCPFRLQNQCPACLGCKVGNPCQRTDAAGQSSVSLCSSPKGRKPGLGLFESHSWLLPRASLGQKGFTWERQTCVLLVGLHSKYSLPTGLEKSASCKSENHRIMEQWRLEGTSRVCPVQPPAHTVVS